MIIRLQIIGDEIVLEKERNLLINFEALEKFRVIQKGSEINFPTDILTIIANNISELHQNICFTKAESELTKYCNSLKKIGTLIQQILGEWNGTIEALNLGIITAEEIPGIVASIIGKFLDNKSTDTVLQRLKEASVRESSMR